MHFDKQLNNNNRFKKIQIDKTNYINERKSLGFGEDEFDFSKALKSINIKPLEFTNYFKGKKDVLYKYVRKEYKKLINKIANLDEEYEMKLVNVDDNFNDIKIKKLYSDTHNIKIHTLPLMYKLKNLNNPNLQFYVVNEKNIFKVCFIDIYHLALPTKDEDTKTKYELNENNNYCLSNLNDK
jgi:hypothetical protein